MVCGSRCQGQSACMKGKRRHLTCGPLNHSSGVACLLFGVQDECSGACARGCLSTFAPRRSENTMRDVISKIRNGFAWPPTFAVFTRDFFIESAGFRFLFWLAEVDFFDLADRLLHCSLPARQALHQDVTVRRTHSFVFRAGVGSFPSPSCTER